MKMRAINQKEVINVDKELRNATAVMLMFIGFIGITYAATNLVLTLPIPTEGEVQAIGLYAFWDIDLTNPVTSIPWGTIPARSSVTSDTIYLWQNSTVDLNVTYDWTSLVPAGIEENLTLTWNQAQWFALASKDTFPIEFTLAVSDTASATPFTFDIIITGEEI